MKNPNSVLDNLEIIKASKRNVILIGSVGSGRNTLFNKICGKNFKIDSGFSGSHDALFSRSLTGNNLIIHFPGLNTIVDFAKHLKEQQAILSAIPVRLICFVIKYSYRYDEIIRSFNQMFLIFRNYRKNIAVIITNTEEMTIKNQSEIQLIFKKLEIKKLIFTKLTTLPLDINDKITAEVEKTTNIEDSINITEEIYNQIKDNNKLDIKFNIIDKRAEYLEKFRKEQKKFLEEFEKKNKESKSALYFSLKEYQKNLAKQLNEDLLTLFDYAKKEDNEFNDGDNIINNNEDGNLPEDFANEIYLQAILFARESSEDLKNLKQKIEKDGIVTESFGANGQNNNIKKCPHCGKNFNV